jgi:hypothetical protein
VTTSPLTIASANGVPGTAAAICEADGTLCLLTNHHVAHGGGSEEGAPVWALPPDPFADGRPVRLGSVRRGVLGRVTFRGEVYFVDCALVTLVAPASLPEWLQLSLNDMYYAGLACADAGLRVTKCGPVTGFTEGVIVDASYPDTPFIEGRSWTATGQLLVESSDPELNFAAEGDSGAALRDDAGRLAGVIWGVNANGQAIASPIRPVLDCLRAQVAPAMEGKGAWR